MKKLLLFATILVALASCSTRTDGSYERRKAMIGKEFTADGLLLRVTDMKTASIEMATPSWNRDELEASGGYIDGLYFYFTKIEANAFTGNRFIKRLIIYRMQSIGDNAFSGCDSLDYILQAGSADTMVLGKRVFANCKALWKANLSNIEIGEETFKGCTSLRAVLTNNILRIDYGAFSGCAALKTFLTNNKTPLTLDASVFEGCETERELDVPKGSEAAYAAAPVWKDFSTIKGSITDW